MGEMYLAAHPWLPREDALKVLPPELTADAEFRARFVREADLSPCKSTDVDVKFARTGD